MVIYNLHDNLNEKTQHINPGTDTTINPVVIDGSYRERKKHPLRCETCDNYDLRDTVQLGEWISVGTCCGKIISDHEVKFVETKGCASHSDTPAHPQEAQQRIDYGAKLCAYLHYSYNENEKLAIASKGKAREICKGRMFEDDQILDALEELRTTGDLKIALLQAGRK